MESHPNLVRKFLRKKVEGGPKYRNEDSSRFPNTNIFDADVKLPGEWSYTERTMVVFRTGAEAESYLKIIEGVKDLSVMKPIKTDLKGAEAYELSPAAHIYERFGQKLKEWARQPIEDLWHHDYFIDGSVRIQGVTDKFRKLYRKLVRPFKALHQEGLYHGKALEGMFVDANDDVRVANLRHNRLDEEDDMVSGQTSDLTAIGRVMSKIVSKSVPADTELPVAVQLYFSQFDQFLSIPSTSTESRLIREMVFMPPLMYNMDQKREAIFMAWSFKSCIQPSAWGKLFADILYPNSSEPMFHKEWRKGISKMIASPLYNEIIKVLKHEHKSKRTSRTSKPSKNRCPTSYEKPHGILDFHRNFLVHFNDSVGRDFELGEAQDLLFAVWPDFVPMLCYGLLSMYFGVNLQKEANPFVKKPDLLNLMKNYSLTFELGSD